MATYTFCYTYDAAKADEMTALRPAHRAYIGEGVANGTVLASGPYTDGSGALIIVRANTADDAAAFMNNDPFWAHDLVAERVIREWKSVLGAFTEA